MNIIIYCILHLLLSILSFYIMCRCIIYFINLDTDEIYKIKTLGDFWKELKVLFIYIIIISFSPFYNIISPIVGLLLILIFIIVRKIKKTKIIKSMWNKIKNIKM